jgi:hypothetical protein
VDPYSALAGGVAALYGPLHGGANEEVLRMLRAVGSKDRIPEFIRQVKAGKAKLMGFGHRVYKNYDPRAKIIKRMADEVFEVTRPSELLPIALELERIALEDDYFVSRKLYPNVDFYSGLIYQALGFPVESSQSVCHPTAVGCAVGGNVGIQIRRSHAPASCTWARPPRLPEIGKRDGRRRAGDELASASTRLPPGYWELTQACDLACRHCRAEAAPEPDPAELTPREGLALIDRLARFGTPLPHLVLTGGDPLKRPDLFELIAAARARGFGVSVAPSATPLLQPEMIARLAAAGVEAISLSLDGSDASQHDALRRVPGCFDRTIAAALACAVVSMPFQVNTLVCEETLADLAAIHAVAAGLGAARWSLFFLVAVGRGTVLRPITAAACEQLFEALPGLADPSGPIIATTEAPHFRRVVLERARRAGTTSRRGATRWATARASGRQRHHVHLAHG